MPSLLLSVAVVDGRVVLFVFVCCCLVCVEFGSLFVVCYSLFGGCCSLCVDCLCALFGTVCWYVPFDVCCSLLDAMRVLLCVYC